MSTWQAASGKQLWSLNTNELLPLALKRAPGIVLDKATAWALLAEFHGLKGGCPGECHWPASCARDGCWLLEHAAVYKGSPNSDEAERDPSLTNDRIVWARWRGRVL